MIEPLKIDGAIDRVYHMASPASPVGYVKHMVATLKVNSQGTWKRSAGAGEKVPLSDGEHSETYGDPAVHPQREDYWGNVNPIGLRSMYDEAKRFSEACTMAYHRERKAETRLIRIFNTYVPRMDPYDGRVVISFIRKALNSEPITIYGEGKQTRSLCYVSDLVRGINLVMESDYYEPINLGNPDEVTIYQIAREILELIPGSTSKSFTSRCRPMIRGCGARTSRGRSRFWGGRRWFREKRGYRRSGPVYRDQLIAK